MPEIRHRFEVIPHEHGYFVTFPALRGCSTNAPTLDIVPQFAREIYDLWITTEREDGESIPPADLKED